MKKIIGFFGGDSQSGTTMTAQSVAESLGLRGEKVLLIMGSGKFGEQFFTTGQGHSIDDIKANIISGKVTYEDLCQVMEEHKLLTLIPSVRNPLAAGYFPVNTFEVMLPPLEDDFDYIIIDGGDNVNLAMTISAMNISQERYIVISQQAKSVSRMQLTMSSVLLPLGFDFKMIINKYIGDPAFLLKNEIEAMCHIEGAFTVPYIEYGLQTEIEGRSLLHFPKYAKAVAAIADEISGIEKREKLWKKNFA